jgi:hypothetical protein
MVQVHAWMFVNCVQADPPPEKCLDDAAHTRARWCRGASCRVSTVCPHVPRVHACCCPLVTRRDVSALASALREEAVG